MLNQRLAAAEAVLPTLRDAEDTLDHALEKSALLVAALVAARRDAGLAIQVGHESVEQACAHLHTMLEGRRGIIATHAQLAELRDRLGLRTRLSGPLGDKPDEDIRPTTPNVVSIDPARAA